MGIEFGKMKVPGGFPVFWRGEFKVLPGDFKLTQTFPVETLIKKGTPIKLDFDNMQATVSKAAKVVAGGTNTVPLIAKGHLLAVGESVKLDEGASTGNVTAIDTTNADYDVLTLSASVGTLAAGNVLVAETAEAPDAVVETDYVYSTKGFQTVSAGYDGVVLREVAAPVAPSWMNGFCLKANPSIKYIKQ
ncbi:hypothetical protein AGMMS49525_04750 [Bacteroidia bacterium]|nr:hypothetical protein AGMMS49525_04750 [Bacteroidia bacterium]